MSCLCCDNESTFKKTNRFYRFEFEESYAINALSLYSSSLNEAIHQVCLIFGDSSLNHVQSINVLD